jgi:hypothetical protein
VVVRTSRCVDVNSATYRPSGEGLACCKAGTYKHYSKKDEKPFTDMRFDLKSPLRGERVGCLVYLLELTKVNNSIRLDQISDLISDISDPRFGSSRILKPKILDYFNTYHQNRKLASKTNISLY